MTIVLSNQEPMALTKYMETYFKDTPPDIHLFSQDNFEIPIHKELFYQTRLMRSMIKSANFECCCSKVWQYGLSSFHGRDKKLCRFLAKSEHMYSMEIIVFCEYAYIHSVELVDCQKLDIALENKVF